MPPTRTYRDLEDLMFEDLRFDRDTILDMDTDMIRKLAPLYRCTTVNTLCRYLGA